MQDPQSSHHLCISKQQQAKAMASQQKQQDLSHSTMNSQAPPKARLTRSSSKNGNLVAASQLAPIRTKKALARSPSDPLGTRPLARVDENKTRQKHENIGHAYKSSSQSTPIQTSDKPPGFLLAVRDGLAPLPDVSSQPANKKRRRDDAETMLAPPRAKRSASTLPQFFALDTRRVPSHLATSTLPDSPLKSSSSIPKSLNSIADGSNQKDHLSIEKLEPPAIDQVLASTSQLPTPSQDDQSACAQPENHSIEPTTLRPSSQASPDNILQARTLAVSQSLEALPSKSASPRTTESLLFQPTASNLTANQQAATSDAFPLQVSDQYVLRDSPEDHVTSESDPSSEQDACEPKALSPTEDKAEAEGFSAQQAKSLAKLQAMMTSMKVRRLSASQVPTIRAEADTENAWSTRSGIKPTDGRRARASTGSVEPKAALRRTSVSAFVAAEGAKRGLLPPVGMDQLEGTIEEGSSGQPQAPLKGVVAYVDVRTGEGDDAGQVFADLLRELGAKVIDVLFQPCNLC